MKSFVCPKVLPKKLLISHIATLREKVHKLTSYKTNFISGTIQLCGLHKTIVQNYNNITCLSSFVKYNVCNNEFI